MGKWKEEEISSLKLKQLHVEIPVRKLIYDANCKQTGLEEAEVLVGDLQRKPAFAGPIAYQSKYGAPLGDMVLIRYHSAVYP